MPTLHFVGINELEIYLEEKLTYRTYVNVVSRKIAREEFERMLQDLNRIAYGLFSDFYSNVQIPLKISDKGKVGTVWLEYSKVCYIFKEMENIMHGIVQQPYSGLETQKERQEWHQIQNMVHINRTLAKGSIGFVTEPTQSQQVTHIPQQFISTRSLYTYDIYENRLLKTFLKQQMINKIDQLEKIFENERTRYIDQNQKVSTTTNKYLAVLEQNIRKCQEMKHRCFQWSTTGFLREVQENIVTNKVTQILLKTPYYHQFYQLYQQLQSQLQIEIEHKEASIYTGIESSATLYEKWSVCCVTELVVSILKEHGYQNSSVNMFYRVQTHCLQWQFIKNDPAIVLKKEHFKIVFTYEPIYLNKESTDKEIIVNHKTSERLTPDLGIEVYFNERIHTIFIFDAKYGKKQEIEIKSEKSKGQKKKWGVTEEMIQKMYLYYHRIQRRIGNSPTEKTVPIVASAYALYPGTEFCLEAIEERIGGLPLVPNEESIQGIKNFLYGLLQEKKLIKQS